MKKLLITLLLFPLMLGGCKKKTTDSEHYIEVAESEITLKVGEQHQIQINELKKTIVLYQSNNDGIASVSDEGVITGVAQGETSISVTGGKDRFVIFVSVIPDEAHDSLQIVMVKNSFTIALDDSFVLPFTVKLGNQVIENPTYSYTYETPNIVSINGLNVSPLAAGTTKCVVNASYNDMSTSAAFTITIY